MSDVKAPKPPIKWVGGKTQLLPEILKVFPEKIETYFEPFTGGGAVFWHLASMLQFKQARLNDWNAELVTVHRVIRDQPQQLMDQLKLLQYDKPMFLEWRAKDPKQLDDVTRAARMIYLNKTGFNGLYRVNKRGDFNVPFGAFKTPPKLFDEQNILACSDALQGVEIHQGDFANGLELAQPGDLVYFDPPYVPLNPTSNFASYTEVGFGLAAQKRLSGVFRDLADRGVKVVLSNSNTPLVRELYEGFEIREVMARRSINSKADGRGAIAELLVVS